MRILALLALAFVADARNLQMTATLTGHRILDGKPAAITDYPTQASLRYSGSHTCGCVHLSNTKQLTAAHCVEGRSASSFDVYYGSSSRTSGGQLAAATAYTMHEHYGQPDGDNAFPNDIATLDVVMWSLDGVTAAAAILPTGNNDFSGLLCNITGWGLTTGGGSGNLPTDLQQAAGVVLTNDNCNERMSSVSGAGVGPYHICIYDSFDESSGSCNGDSGGPMHCMEDGVKVVAGITSWGITSNGNCAPDYPSVYTRVSYFLDWLPAQ